jgi:uncharacterized DUF497 family protein
MLIEFDAVKNAKNLAKHGLSLEAVQEFEWDKAMLAQDTRKDYGETRIIATGYIRTRLYVMIYTERGLAKRIISLRKANDKERQNYERRCS